MRDEDGDVEEGKVEEDEDDKSYFCIHIYYIRSYIST